VRSPGIASDPFSLVAAETHLGRWPAVITGGWPDIPYSNHVPLQQFLENRLEQHDKNVSVHQVDVSSCLLERQKRKE